MNDLRQIIGSLFEAPMGNKSFVSYFKYADEGGKITARTLREVCTVILTFLEEQEKKNQQNEANFKEIEAILTKLVNQSTPKVLSNSGPVTEDKFLTGIETLNSELVNPKVRTPKEEETYQKRIVALSKAREAKKAKAISVTPEVV